MNLAEYKAALESLPYGKRLPNALYVFREEGASFGPELDKLLAQLITVFSIPTEFNVLKFRTDELKVSFLSYPDFLEHPHPSLRHAITLDLVTGKRRDTDYADNLNPPILHRKESFLSPNHARRAEFAALTQTEEAEGLYEETSTIGFKLNWDRLLAAKGLRIEGHQLCKIESGSSEKPKHLPVPIVERHKTALTRYDLSKPVKTLMEYALLKPGLSFFDYGCGQGSDVEGLKALGYEVAGWDPVFRSESSRQPADVVNLGYVLNVIEDPAERLEALCSAYQLSRKLLVVAGLVQQTTSIEAPSPFRDGILTKRNTFQKYFEQQELQQYIEDALETTAIPVALGIFYVFRNPEDHQDFLAARTKRAIDWTQIAARLGLGRPARTVWEALYRENKDLVESFGSITLSLGRFPAEAEFESLAELTEKLGSPKRALRAYVECGGVQQVDWQEVKVRFGIGQPRRARWQVLYEQNQELLGAFWKTILQLGRLPGPEEFERHEELCTAVGSSKRALRILFQRGGEPLLKEAAEARRNDLLVYVALANLRKRVPFGHLSPSLRLDIKEFFGNYTAALKAGLELLYAAGDPGEIELACENLNLGWQDEQALYFHKSLLDSMPPLLRAYVGCAVTLFGDVQQADVIKLHKASGKVTFLRYDDFQSKERPILRQRTKINLRTRWVQVFDHNHEQQGIENKERLLSTRLPTSSRTLAAALHYK